jgi:dipeptidyl aminopeptidase/acylaminoacyl peptidase
VHAVVAHVGDELALGWSPDGRTVAFVRYDFKTLTSTLVVADADFRNQRTIYAVRQPQLLRDIFNDDHPSVRPAWSPDGKWIAVAGEDSAASRPAEGSSIIELDAATGAVRRIHQIDQRPNELAYLDDDRIIAAVSASRGGSAGWRLYPRTGEPVLLTSDLAAIRGVQLTADRGMGVAGRTAERSSIWSVNPANGAANEVVAESGSRPDWGALDSRGNLWYSQQVPGGEAVFRLAANAGAGQLVARNLRAPMASPDGQFAIAWSDDGFVRVDLDGRTTPFVADPIAFPGGLTPDGSALLFASNKAGHQQPWIAPLDGSGARRLAAKYLSGGHLYLSRDGRHVVFHDSDLGKNQMCDFPTFDRCRDLGGVGPGPLSADGRFVYAVLRRDPMNIVAQPLDGGETRPVTHFTDERIGSLRVSADFKTLVFTRVARESNVVLIRGLK